MNTRTLTGTLVPAGLFMLAACATPGPSYDPVLPIKAPASAGNTLILISQLPEKPSALDVPIDVSSANTTAMNMVNTGQVSPAAGAAGGILGALVVAAIDAGIDANRNGNFRSMLDERNVDVEAEFRTALLAALDARSVLIETPEFTRTKPGLQAHASLRDLGQQPVLDIVVQQYGYNLGFASGWTPSITVETRLTDPATGEILMAETVVYGSPASMATAPQAPASAYSNGPGNAAIIVPFDPEHVFPSPNAFITENPDLAIEGLRFALASTADTVAGLLAPMPAATIVETNDLPDTAGLVPASEATFD